MSLTLGESIKDENERNQLDVKMKISVSTDISILEFYGYIGYIGDISMDIFT